MSLIICSKQTVETAEQCMKSVQSAGNKKVPRKSLASP